MPTLLDKLHDTVIKLTKDVGTDIIVDKSLVNRYSTSFYIAYKDGNIVSLGDTLPDDIQNETTPTSGKYILLVTKGKNSWDVLYSVDVLDDDISQSEAQDKALSSRI